MRCRKREYIAKHGFSMFIWYISAAKLFPIEMPVAKLFFRLNVCKAIAKQFRCIYFTTISVHPSTDAINVLGIHYSGTLNLPTHLNSVLFHIYYYYDYYYYVYDYSYSYILSNNRCSFLMHIHRIFIYVMFYRSASFIECAWLIM